MTLPNWLLIFFGKETHSETQSWKSSRILTKKDTTTTVNPGNRRGLRVKPNFFNFSLFIIFRHFLFFSIYSFSFFQFFAFFSFSFIFFQFLSFFFFFFSFSFIIFFFVGCSKSDVFWASISLRFLLTDFYVKNQFLGPSQGEKHLWALFSFFLLFFSCCFVFFSCFLIFSFFSFFVHFFIF